jgi:hypothetical protein
VSSRPASLVALIDGTCEDERTDFGQRMCEEVLEW